MTKQLSRALRLPKAWQSRVRSAVLSAIGLAKYSLLIAQGQASEDGKAGARQNSQCQRLQQDVAQLREELRIKDARMSHLPPHRRPHYPPTERMAILELRAARGWSLAQTAEAFLVTEATISSWLSRLDEQGPKALVALREPVNKFPDFVSYLVQRLGVLCPTMGKVKLAQTLARAGLHLGATTVGRMLKATPRGAPLATPTTKPQVVTARSPNHVWHIDLTVVPTTGGLWASWLPLTLPQRWPFCWWVAVIVDHFSRRVMGIGAFPKPPTSKATCDFLGRTIRSSRAQPKHLICDKGRQFWCNGFKRWCRRRDIRVRFGAVGQHGSIALIERFIRTLKDSLVRAGVMPLQAHTFRRELQAFAGWFNELRPHTALGSCTPNEVYQRRFPAVRRPRYEPRRAWPRGSPCARPWALARHNPGARLKLEVAFHAGGQHLPIVTLKRAA